MTGRGAEPPRVVVGAGALERLGEEAAALGSRALVVSTSRPEPREERLLREAAGRLRQAGVGNQPFPRVPVHARGLGGCKATAAEAAREGHCRLVLGIGDDEPLQVARGVAGAALLPCIVVPSAVGYGPPAFSTALPLPAVLVLDPAAAGNSPPRRTAALGVALFAGILERYAAPPPPPTGRRGGPTQPDEATLTGMEQAMRGLLDHLPRAVQAPADPRPREGLAAAVAHAAQAMGRAGPGPEPLGDLLVRLASGAADLASLRAAVVATALEEARLGEGVLEAARVARLGRTVLGIQEVDDGRAASWTAGGIRQWLRTLGFETRLREDSIRGFFSGARR